MRKIRIDDEVVVIAGKDKGQRGRVSAVVGDGDKRRLVIEGINMAKKHVKPNPNSGVEGGIVDKEMPIHISNVALFQPDAERQWSRVGFKIDEEGKKARIFRNNGAVVDKA